MDTLLHFGRLETVYAEGTEYENINAVKENVILIKGAENLF